MRLRAVLPALAVAALATGSPVHADPTDGQGCAGLPEVPETYVCLIEANTAGSTPSPTWGPGIDVPVPRVCYVAGCVGPTTVNIPSPGIQPGEKALVVLWYQGTYIPIGIGNVPPLPPVGVPPVEVPPLPPLPEIDPCATTVPYGDDVMRNVSRTAYEVGQMVSGEDLPQPTIWGDGDLPVEPTIC